MTITPLDASVIASAIVFLAAIRWLLRAVPGAWTADRGHRLPDRPVMAKAEAAGLVKKWRGWAGDAHVAARSFASSTNQDVCRARAMAYEHCSDDLEKALDEAKSMEAGG